MKWIQGTPRDQLVLYTTCLDEIISFDCEVRLIDAFVESLDLGEMGFNTNGVEDGRPKYHSGDLLKIFIYGYMNRIRSSRMLERMCQINIEMMWLVKQLSPDHNTINNFRKENAEAIKEVFRATVNMAKHFDLIGAKLLAGDSTKFRAQNSKKNNYNKKKVQRHQAYIEEKLRKYQEQLESAQTAGEKAELKDQIEKQEKRKEQYADLSEQLGKMRGNQISTSDPDSRHMIIRNNITEVAYNVQTTVDGENKLLLDYEVTNSNDSKAMGNVVERACEVLGHHEFTMLFDKGYHTGSEFTRAEQAGVEVLVSIPAIPSASQAPDPRFNKSEFVYDSKRDTYTCPEGKELHPSPSEYTYRDSSKPAYSYKFKRYRTTACRTCPSRALCTRSKLNVRHIERSEHSGAIERNGERMQAREALYKNRQSIVEHPYGTMKRQWGFDHVMTKKTIARASSDIGLIMCAYNLRRLFNLLTTEEMCKYLQEIRQNIVNLYHQAPWMVMAPNLQIEKLSWKSNEKMLTTKFLA